MVAFHAVSRKRAWNRSAQVGLWLAFGAIAGQVFVPYLLAFAIFIAGPQSAVGGVAFCSADHTISVPTSGREHPTEHRLLPGSCPVCQTLAASHAFTQPTLISIVVPLASADIRRFGVPSRRSASFPTTAFYQSRAPPSSI